MESGNTPSYTSLLNENFDSFLAGLEHEYGVLRDDLEPVFEERTAPTTTPTDLYFTALHITAALEASENGNEPAQLFHHLDALDRTGLRLEGEDAGSHLRQAARTPVEDEWAQLSYRFEGYADHETLGGVASRIRLTPLGNPGFSASIEVAEQWSEAISMEHVQDELSGTPYVSVRQNTYPTAGETVTVAQIDIPSPYTGQNRDTAGYDLQTAARSLRRFEQVFSGIVEEIDTAASYQNQPS